MQCPHEGHGELSEVLTRRGVIVERCGACDGLWLDRGELFQLTRRPRAIRRKLETALEESRPGRKPSPATGEPMDALSYSEGIEIDHCPRSGGLWLEAATVKALERREPGLRFDADRKAGAPAESSFREGRASVLPSREGRAGVLPSREGRASVLPSQSLLALPNLFLRSTLALTGMYVLLGIVVIAAVEFAGVDLVFAVGAGVGVALLQFLLGPFLMDLTLRWLYTTRPVTLAQLPEHLGGFVQRICEAKDIAPPRFVVIEDGAPQAFTYGHTPNNARIVISQGLMELLDPEEVEAVVAHEIGHAVHWDMALMTIAQLVPLLLYYLYRSLIDASSSSDGDGKEKGGVALVAVVAFLLYIVSEYMVLWFSRTREYHADRFAGEATGAPGHLAAALVKIAYGLAGRRDLDEPERQRRLDAVGALGIFDAGAAKALAVSSAASAASGASGTAVDKDNLRGAMRWDLWNPWARWYELNSTHPLVANRLRYLSNQARHMGQAPYVTFDERRPESYWDEFAVDLFVHLLPTLALVVPPAVLFVLDLWHAPGAMDHLVPTLLLALGAALAVRFHFAYRGDAFPDMSVAALLKCVKVSAIRPVPCTLRGEVIGRGVPGYIFSEDFVMRDDTGIMFLDYRQPLAIWELLFGLMRAGGYKGRQIVVEGWYRRAPVPYLEIKSIECDGKRRRSWVPLLYQITALVLIALGVAWAAVPGDLPAWLAANCEAYWVGFECSL